MTTVQPFQKFVAAVILEEYNLNNRKVRSGTVKRYASLVGSGEWMLNGETIKFGRTRLLDGQHRLRACAASETPLVTLAVFGLEDAVFPSLDDGDKRRPYDVLGINGVPDPNNTAAAIRWVHKFDAGTPRSRAALSPMKVLELYENKYPDIHESVRAGRRLHDAHRVSASQSGALHYLFARRDRDKADEFFRVWSQEVRTLRGGHPVARLHDAILNIRAVNGRVGDDVQVGLIITAWNHFYAGKKTIPEHEMTWVFAGGADFPPIAGEPLRV